MKILFIISLCISLCISFLNFVIVCYVRNIAILNVKKEYPNIAFKKQNIIKRVLSLIKAIVILILPIYNLFAFIGHIIYWDKVIPYAEEEIRNKLNK